MGHPKLLSQLRGKPLVRWAGRAMSQAGYAGCWAVLPPDETGQRLRDALGGLDFNFLTNPDPARGMMSSFQVAARAMPDDLLGVNFALADMPFLTAQVHAAMLEAFAQSTGPDENRVSRIVPLQAYTPLVLAEYGAEAQEDRDAVRAPPHLFRRDLVREMLSLPDADHGPRELVRQYARRGLVVRFPTDLLLDVDTPEALAQAEQRLRGT